MDNFKNIIDNFSKAKILVVGDLILDEYIWGDVERISPEAPVPVVSQRGKPKYLPGGAANVAANLKSLGAEVLLCGRIGDDFEGRLLLKELKRRSIYTEGVFIDKIRPTTKKTRIIAGHQQVVRLDREVVEDFYNDVVARKISCFVLDNLKDIDVLIIEDYGKGVINRVFLNSIYPETQRRKKIVTVDPKEDHFDIYWRLKATAITPNRKEAENAIKNIKIKDNRRAFKIDFDRLDTDERLNRAGRELLRYLNIKIVLITLGEKGMRLFEKNKAPYQINTVAQEVFDVSGAGDTVISVFSLGLASGANPKEAAHIANFAAGIVVGKFGVAVTTKEELLNRIKEYGSGSSNSCKV
ncbi:MAG: bifunctional ADP-heptose synthase [Candidatus Omnitrophica bacterium]|nr:bifunctional ADP-heptose synthase [Candidatus Omnitrophota bacterium]MCM8799580.1 bifunctional ADP-heptose synthase [Candidatus Omnitrophota bacterium]